MYFRLCKLFYCLPLPPMQVDWKKIWLNIRKYVLNKYLLTCAVFAFVLTFCGDNSLVNRAKRAKKISQMEAELSDYRQQTEQYKSEIQKLNANRDNLERFAREHYYMRQDNEDVFLIEEDE